jgi:hypothetical protein
MVANLSHRINNAFDDNERVVQYRAAARRMCVRHTFPTIRSSRSEAARMLLMLLAKHGDREGSSRLEAREAGRTSPETEKDDAWFERDRTERVDGDAATLGATVQSAYYRNASGEIS